MGGFDIFKAKEQEKNMWSNPENLGYPINSGADDIFYSYDNKSKRGYFSSMRKDGVGNYDIYTVRNPKRLNTSLIVTFTGNLPHKKLIISIIDVKTKVKYDIDFNKISNFKYKSDNEYKILIPNYNNNEVLDIMHFKTPINFEEINARQEFVFSEVKNKMGDLIGYQTTIYSALFDLEQEIIKSGAYHTKVLSERFPACRLKNLQFDYYKKHKRFNKRGRVFIFFKSNKTWL